MDRFGYTVHCSTTMPRYLSFPVGGDASHIAHRSYQALKSIGKVEDFDSDAGLLAGVVRVEGEPAQLKITWKPENSGNPDNNKRFLLDLEADSSDGLSKAADRALYTFARAYKNTDPTSTTPTSGNRAWLPWIVFIITATLLAGYFLLRHV
jgi:hypothetical protein